MTPSKKVNASYKTNEKNIKNSMKNTIYVL